MATTRSSLYFVTVTNLLRSKVEIICNWELLSGLRIRRSIRPTVLNEWLITRNVELGSYLEWIYQHLVSFRFHTLRAWMYAAALMSVRYFEDEERKVSTVISDRNGKLPLSYDKNAHLFFDPSM